MKPIPKVKPWRSPPYRKFVASCSCSVCGVIPCEPHHYQRDGEGCMGGKVSDAQCVPLCAAHHREFHQVGKKSFFIKHHEWDPDMWIISLNAAYEKETGRKVGEETI